MPSVPSFFKTNVIVPVVRWIEQEAPGFPVVVLRQNAERPLESYYGIELITPLAKPGQRDDIIHKSDTTFTICGQRSVTVQISAYLIRDRLNRNIHDDMYVPHEMLKVLQDSVDNPSKMQVLRDAGLAVWSAGDILDIPEAVETGFESRASMEVVMGLVSSRDVDLGAIESVEITGTANGMEDPTVTVEDA